MIQNYHQKVAPTARLSGIKGSYQKRTDLAVAKNDEFFNLTKDIFLKNGEITKDELKDIFRHLCPGIEFKLRTTKPEKKYNGALNPQLQDKKVSSYILELPFIEKNGKKVILYQNNIFNNKSGTLFHETQHFFDYITNPKFPAKSITLISHRNKGLEERMELYNDFYKQKLYPEDISTFNIFVKDANKMLNKQKNDKTKELEELKASITKIFDKPEILPTEKIEVMQNWRHNLKTERNAFSAGVNLSAKLHLEFDIKEIQENQNMIPPQNLNIEEYKNSLIDTKKNTLRKCKDSDLEFLDSKIKLVEELLKKEIKKARENPPAEIKKSSKILKPLLLIGLPLLGIIAFACHKRNKKNKQEK